MLMIVYYYESRQQLKRNINIHCKGYMCQGILEIYIFLLKI